MQMHLFNEYEGQLEQKQKELEETKTNKDEEIKSLKSQIQAKAVAKAQLASVKTQAVSAPAPVAVKYAVGCEVYRPLIAQHSWDQRIAMAVMEAESGCDPQKPNWNDTHYKNGVVYCKGSFGLFQIACFDGQVYDPAKNVAIAWRKYSASGWNPWGAYTNGSYLKYLR